MKRHIDLKAALAVFLAINLAGIAVSLFLKAGLGSDPITVIIDGVHNMMNVSYGTASRIYNILFLMLALIAARKHIGWTTVFYALCVGTFIDLYTGLLPTSWITSSLVARWMAVFIGQLMFGLCFALMIRFQKGMNQIDALSTWFVENKGVSYVFVRTLFDIGFITAGYIMGGIVGLGTIFSALTTGISVKIFLGLLKAKNS